MADATRLSPTWARLSSVGNREASVPGEPHGPPSSQDKALGCRRFPLDNIKGDKMGSPPSPTPHLPAPPKVHSGSPLKRWAAQESAGEGDRQGEGTITPFTTQLSAALLIAMTSGAGIAKVNSSRTCGRAEPGRCVEPGNQVLC